MVESRQSQHFTDIIYTVVVVPIITEAHVHVCLHDRIFSQHTLAYPEVKTEKKLKRRRKLADKDQSRRLLQICYRVQTDCAHNRI